VYSFEMAGEGEEEEGEEEADLTKTPIMKEQWITIQILTLACITSLLPDPEFSDFNLTKDSSLLLHAIHSPFYWRIFKKTHTPMWFS
jgi:hypothetical protein